MEQTQSNALDFCKYWLWVDFFLKRQGVNGIPLQMASVIKYDCLECIRLWLGKNWLSHSLLNKKNPQISKYIFSKRVPFGREISMWLLFAK